MAETATPPTAPTGRDASTTANNIVQGISSKANGKAPQPTETNNGKTPAPVDPNAGKEKYTVDGKDIWLSPEQARAYTQKGIAFEPKVTQLGHLQNEIGSFMKQLASDPLKILTDKRIGMTPEAVLEKIFAAGNISDAAKEKVGQWYYENVVEPMKLSPEELKARENAKYREERERQDASAKDMAIKEENQRRVDMALGQIKSQIAEAMKESGLPTIDSPLGTFMSRRVADVMRLGYLQRQTVTPKDAIEHVKQELKSIQSSWYDHLDEDALVKELGEKNAEKVKKYFLKLVKDSEKKIPKNQKMPSPAKSGERKTISTDDMADYLAALKKENAPTKFK